eukprot:CAMPEP_0204370748 /NCGR_PEP_ID=MMETSP0469-20131031/45978_1 /ASSEMBLY_ACC=CAM_ASM_000384 /TAXON_ID=2969 /ORGANISM="Oxyrrhis marina" /LENGTH=364 /DNA_ID=CAMNT_0051360727 /DNA_START=19 /DNA_END=1110 /DNA_ORIENTATION=+
MKDCSEGSFGVWYPELALVETAGDPIAATACAKAPSVTRARLGIQSQSTTSLRGSVAATRALGPDGGRGGGLKDCATTLASAERYPADVVVKASGRREGGPPWQEGHGDAGTGPAHSEAFKPRSASAPSTGAGFGPTAPAAPAESPQLAEVSTTSSNVSRGVVGAITLSGGGGVGAITSTASAIRGALGDEMTSIPGATLGAADSATTSTPAAIGGAVGGVITSPVACLKPFAPRIRPEPFLKPPSPPAVPTSRPVARGASVASRGAVGCCITSAPDAACGAVGNATISTPGAARGVVRARYQSGLGVAATAAAAWRRAGSGGPALFAGDCTRPRAFGVTLPGGLRLPEDARLADRLRQGGRSF